MNICVYGAASRSIDKKYLDIVENLGEEIAKRGYGLVFGGGDSGAMGATARGAKKGGAKTILGIAPRFFDVDGILYKDCTEFIFTDSMRERKKLLEENSNAFIIAPGGIGTFDEFFEILTLKQLGRHNKPIAIFNAYGYYNPLEELMNNAVRENFLKDLSKSLYKTCSSIDEIFDYIENYHDAGIKSIEEYKDIYRK